MGSGRRDPKRPARPGDRGGGSPRRRDLEGFLEARRRPPRDAAKPVGPRRASLVGPGQASPTITAGELLFGRNAVLEALQAGRPIRRVLIAESAHGDGVAQIVEAARSRGVAIQTVERQRLDALAGHHQGVVAEAAPFRYASLEELLEAALHSSASPRSGASPPAGSAAPLILVLDTLQDPQNFGSLLRTAAAVGAHGAIIPEHRAVGVTPAVAKASAGATERLRIARVGNLTRALETLKSAGLWIVGLDARAEKSHLEADLGGPLAVVVGGEGKGIRPLVRQACDFVVKLPMPGRAAPLRGQIESLNAAVAGSVLLYEILRQRSTPPLGELPGRG